MEVSTHEASDLFHALIRVQKLLLAARSIAPKMHPGMEAAAYPVMFAIHQMGQVGISDVAALLHSDVSTISRQVSGLAAHGLLDKQPDPADRRAMLVSLTDTGQVALDEVKAARGEWFQQLLAAWQADETEFFTKQLQRLGDALDQDLRDRGASAPTILSAPDRPSTKEN